MSFTQRVFTSYQPYADGNTRIGELYRIWYDSITHTLRIQLDPTTPGGTIIAGGGAVSGPAQGITFVGDDSTGTRISDGETLKVTATGGITTAVTGDTLTITGTEGISNLYYGAFHADNDTTLTADINSNTTDPLAVASTTGFPSSGSLIVELEIISYTGKTATTFTGITRGVAGSNSSSHSSGTAVAAAQVTPAGVPKTVLMDITDLSSGVTLNASTGEVTIVNAGTYNCQFSVQTANAGNTADNVVVWFVVDGTAVPSTASYSTISAIHAGQPGASIMTVNIFYTFTAGQKLTLKWTTVGGTSVITSYPRNIATGVPASPGVILTVNRIA